MKIGNSSGIQNAVVGMGMAALGATSHANVFYVNFPDVTIGPDTSFDIYTGLFGSVSFDFSTPAITAQQGPGATANFWPYDAKGERGKSAPSVRQSAGGGTSMAFGLIPVGTTIDGSLIWNSGSPILVAGDLVNAYTGIRVETSPGEFHYGWIRFHTGPGVTQPLPFFNDGPVPGPTPGSDGLASTITLVDAAFETEPNTGIQAVPEVPGGGAIAFLGLAGGAAAFRRYRARKQ